MADAFWRYGDNRQPAASLPAQLVAKRARSEFEMPSEQVTTSYYVPGNERAGSAVAATDMDHVNASYERYLRDLKVRVQLYGGQTGRPATAGLDDLHDIDDLRLMQSGPEAAARSRLMGVGGRPEISLPPDTSSLFFMDGLPANFTRTEVSSQLMGVRRRPEIALPPDATSTLYVEGLPANCTRREVSHIFRPFVGYKEVRLVTKAPRHPGGDPVVLSFVDFVSPAHAATAMDAIQGYLFDEHERDSAHLRVQFARNPPGGTRVGGGHRGNH
ncbi:hypothetical protein SASPL_149286 [Salvia splendens]|uniref:RRM domain-containing protein n=1 Tax=Salvia splendens TaxID=180675 RepID=A0A8X8WAK5_SALSN|nr:nuclear speckle RNA-binding protein A-like [Salvia splendens]XP_042033778.1 nuclear speckle RNA-binding protein A-like [Salvia splendens]KAG6391530.1 hypothetical protein SASPL_149286 [Salvia splendens]